MWEYVGDQFSKVLRSDNKKGYLADCKWSYKNPFAVTTATRLLHHLLGVGNEISACKGPGGMVARKGSKDEWKNMKDMLTAMLRARSDAALAKQQHASAIEAAAA